MILVAVAFPLSMLIGFDLALFGFALVLATLATGYRFYDARRGNRVEIRWALLIGFLIIYFDVSYLLAVAFRLAESR